MKLARKSGAQVERPPKNLRNKKGDVDVIARYTFPWYAVGFQVKKHGDGSKTDEFGVSQIIEAIRDEQLEIDIGCVVTTANDFADDAKVLAAGAPGGAVRLIARNELTQWLLSSGISFLE